jgi:D-3-phosphoglycerate dehydrogenase
MMKTILTTTSSFGLGPPDLLGCLEKNNLRMVHNPLGRKLTETELERLLDEHRPVGLLAGTESITAKVLNKAKAYLRVISRVGVGWDNVDRVSAAGLGIPVYRTEGILRDSVSELTIGMILSALRRLTDHDRLIRTHLWEKRMGGLLQGKVLGIIGFGAIGRRVGELAKAFGAEVLFVDSQSLSAEWATAVSLDDLLARADIITLHASGTETILGAEEIKYRCKRGVIIVNTARGCLMDEIALKEGLENGQVGYACLDVFHDEPYQGPLCEMENILLTPHIGSYAAEVRQRMEMAAVVNLLDGLRKAGVLKGDVSD